MSVFWWYWSGGGHDLGMDAISDLAALVRNGGARFAAGYVHRIGRGRCPLHAHAGFEIVHHQRGRGSSGLGTGDEIRFAEGDVTVYAPHEQHDQDQAVAGIDACIHIAVAGAMPRGLPACFHLAAPFDPWLHRELHELSSGQAGAGPLERLSLDLRAGALLLRLIADAGATVRAAERAAAGDGHAERADRLIAERFRDIGRLEEVAAELGIGYDHLRHVYRRRYGRSLVRRLMEARIERAKALLAHAPIPVTQVAGEVGYATARHFAAVFRAMVGSTPTAYRESVRG